MQNGREMYKGKELYVKSYSSSPKTIRIDEYDVPLPDMPPQETMENFGERRRQQIFSRTKVPRNIRQWDERDRREFVAAEWHKRMNGVWYLINGKPVYLTGPAYVYFNYWHIEAGGLPDFRMEAVEFFLLWEMVERDKNCYGLLDIKARRLGDTEKALFLLWEYTSRIRKAWAGMQNITETDAKDNFKRIVDANERMIFFFKPVSRGSSNPEKVLEFRYPEGRVTKKSLEGESTTDVLLEDDEKVKRPLGSKIDYETTKVKRYDGKRLSRYHLDEPGKMTEMNPVKQWGVIKPAMALQGGRVIVGKAIFTTTVEEMSNGKTLKNALKLWEGADPKVRDGNGKTANGMIRVFRNALYGAPVDRWGFHQKQEMERMLLAERDALLLKGWLEDYTDLCRRQPLTLDDVFTLPAEECRLLPALLDNRSKQLRERLNPDGTPCPPKANRYSLVWRNGVFGGQVDAVLDQNGRFEISQHPIRPNYIEILDNQILPGNRRIYKSGMDPVDHTTEDGGGSKVGFTVFRSYDEAVDGHLAKDENGEILPEEVFKMQTDQFVLAYSHRPDDPYESYEDCLKAMIYYGCPTLSENQKPGFLNWIATIHGGKWAFWAMRRPSQTVTTTNQGRTKTGAPATPSVVNLYVDALLYFVKRRIACTHLPMLIADWRQFKVTNRKDRDLSVASGFNLLAVYDNIQQISEEKKDAWTNSKAIWKKHKRAA